MRVQEVILQNNKKRYMLLDESGMPNIPAMEYLKYLDNIGKSSNTLKTYCYSLKLYFEYLHEINVNYHNVNLNSLANFVGWLRNPYENNNIIGIKPTKSKRTERTINLIMTVVTNFYDYMYRSEQIHNDLPNKIIKHNLKSKYTSFKNFLYHVNKDRPAYKNVLRLKTPRKKLTVLNNEEVAIIYNATTNIRDKFLIKLLFETGLRIGEALSLYIEDLIYDHQNGHRIKLKNRGEMVNGAKLKTGERDIFVSQELMDLFDDYEYEVLDELELDTNFLFIKIKGENKGCPLEYQDVNALFKNLKRKTGIAAIHPHLFRHTHATIFYCQTKDIKQLQERLGHAYIQTTINTYVHPSDEDIRKGWELAQSAFNFGKRDDNIE
jgi:Site-specific recombinase XerD